VPFIRYTRDKRGFENTLVMHAYREPNGSQRARVLYMFRSPGSVRVGRQPLDEEVVEALEHTHPALAFDWEALLRKPVEVRPVGQKKGRRPTAKQTSGGPAPVSRETAAQPAIVIDDVSTLGRALGATAAADVRRRYRELLDRILRRARTPEDRDRLTERAQRLNPDDWSDEASVKKSLEAAEAEWTDIAAELPRRRRGRRGGRRRAVEGPAEAAPPGEAAGESEGQPGSADEQEAAGAGAPDEPPGPSGIMTEEGSSNAVQDDKQVAGTDRPSDGAGDGGSVGPEPDDGADPAAADVRRGG
jgi:hypothetical protein